MTFPTHLLAGLIIGKITGQYTAAIAGSLVIDIDHLVSYFKNGILFKPRALLKAMKNEHDPWDDQRNFLHSVFAWAIVTIIFCYINMPLGSVFSVAYLGHLVFDALDGAVFYPFFPLRKFVLRGGISYHSRAEAVFTGILATMFLYLFIM
ncbi:MAG: LexA-binding, inner rane-associated putative hydrolase [Candidatus Parcubacteria bacterium]|jgi:hypothetical protein